MRFSILTLFPEYFASPLSCSLIGRAIHEKTLSVDLIGLRDFGEGRYRAVDDKPYGGGQGMVLMPLVLEHAFQSLMKTPEGLEALERSVQAKKTGYQNLDKSTPYVVYLSPQGKKLDAKDSRRFATYPHIAFLCGHYEGIDERAIDAFVHEEISIGDYILTGGEPAALVAIDSISRFIPGVIGDPESVENDTFETPHRGALKYPAYTRPLSWRGREVPEVLLSGHHGEIAKWRETVSRERTAKRRPDLIKS